MCLFGYESCFLTLDLLNLDRSTQPPIVLAVASGSRLIFANQGGRTDLSEIFLIKIEAMARAATREAAPVPCESDPLARRPPPRPWWSLVCFSSVFSPDPDAKKCPWHRHFWRVDR
jgi:hypothetical protein